MDNLTMMPARMFGKSIQQWLYLQVLAAVHGGLTIVYATCEGSSLITFDGEGKVTQMKGIARDE